MFVKVKNIPVRYNKTTYTAGAEFEVKDEHLTGIESFVEVIEGKRIEDMTVAELKAYAASAGIDLGEAAKKPDILAIILEAQKQE